MQRNLKGYTQRKLKIVQNKRKDSDSESEEGEIEDEDSVFENHDTFERECYRPFATHPEDELYQHTDGEINTGENETENITT